MEVRNLTVKPIHPHEMKLLSEWWGITEPRSSRLCYRPNPSLTHSKPPPQKPHPQIPCFNLWSRKDLGRFITLSRFELSLRLGFRCRLLISPLIWVYGGKIVQGSGGEESACLGDVYVRCCQMRWGIWRERDVGKRRQPLNLFRFCSARLGYRFLGVLLRTRSW